MLRRTFLQTTGTALAGTLLTDSALAAALAGPHKRVAMVGTGQRGLSMWGPPVLREFGDQVEFVGLCDSNPGRVATGKKMLGVSCPTFTDFDQMMQQTKPDLLLVTTPPPENLRAAAQRRHRRRHLGRLPLVPRRAPRRRLLPALAPSP